MTEQDLRFRAFLESGALIDYHFCIKPEVEK